MEPRTVARRLIINADDFGRSSAINQAVILAHQEGIITTTSLMVGGAAFDEAVDLARQNPKLGVGLHLTLLCGQSTLERRAIPGLVNERRQFSQRPVWTGFRYFISPGLRPQLRFEMDAQFRKFRDTGLRLDHLNGHLNLHLHPTVFSLIKHHMRDWSIGHFRLTRDPLWLNLRIARGRWFYRLSHALIFGMLTRRAEHTLHKWGTRHTGAVFGLLQSGRITEQYLLDLLPRLPEGDSELYCHPSMIHATGELAALTSARVRSLLRDLNIVPIRYQDL